MNKPTYMKKSKRTQLEEKKAIKQTNKGMAVGNRRPEPIDLDSDLISSSSSEELKKLEKNVIDLD